MLPAFSRASGRRGHLLLEWAAGPVLLARGSFPSTQILLRPQLLPTEHFLQMTKANLQLDVRASKCTATLAPLSLVKRETPVHQLAE